jgi:hypothetical protein
MTYRKSLAVALSLMLFLIMGTMHRSYASHLTQHTHHHTPATHSTGVCSWMCAAAQTISGDAHIIPHSFQLIALMEWTLPKFSPLIAFTFLPTRAPPR